MLNVKTRGGAYGIPYEEILYLEKAGNKICVHVRNGAFEFCGTMKEVMESLDDRFMRCHRSFIVSLDSILLVHNGEVTFRGGKKLYLGSKTCPALSREYCAYGKRKVLNGEKR